MCFKCQGTLWCLGVSGLVKGIYSETIHFYNYYHSPIVFSKKVSFYCFFFVVISIFDLGCRDTPFLASCQCRTPKRVRLAGFWCPASILFFFFLFFFSFLWHAPTRLRRVRLAISEEKKKIKDFESEKSFWETHLLSSQPTLPLTSPTALCPSPELDRADRRAP